MEKIILLCGRKRTGKGLAAKILSSLISQPQEFAFATPIKEFCINVLGLRYEQVYGESEERESPTQYKWGDVAEAIRLRYNKDVEEYLTGRDVLQIVGSDLFRNQFYRKLWAEAGVRLACESKKKVGIFNDVRFKDEIEAAYIFSKRKAYQSPLVIRVYRDTKYQDNHASEVNLDEFDHHPLQRILGNDLVPDGYGCVQDGLYVKQDEEVRNPFKYLVDNNYDESRLEHNLEKIVELEGMQKKTLMEKVVGLVLAWKF